jgi:LysR family hydrogen peroxide-inducible transcriptional activator
MNLLLYIPENHHSFQKKEIEINDLNVDEILLLQDGHCFRDGILNLWQNITTVKQSLSN